MLGKDAEKRLLQLLDENPFIPIYSAVAQVLKDDIINCKLHPGERLKEINTAEQFNVNRSTIRKAFELLSLDGVVIRRHNRGVEIAPMLRSEYKEIAEIRTMLDSYAARLAATRRTSKDLQNMRMAIDMLAESATVPNMDAWSQSDTMFHKAVYDASHNSHILRIYGAFSLGIIRARYISAPGMISMINRIVQEHIEIYNAIANQDAFVAAHVAEKHTQILRDPSILSVKGLEDGKETE